MVVTSRPSASKPSIKHERIERPSTSTVHVPHSPSSQPCLVPVSPRSSRSTSSRVLWTGTSVSRESPLTFSVTRTFIGAPPSRASAGGAPARDGLQRLLIYQDLRTIQKY